MRVFRFYHPHPLCAASQGALWLLKIAIGTVSNVDLPLHAVLGAVINTAAGEMLDSMPRNFNADATIEVGQSEEFKRLHGPAYEALCKFLENAEPRKEALCCRCLRRFCGKAPASRGTDWRDHMVRVKNGIGGWAWVRRSNAEAYRVQNA